MIILLSMIMGFSASFISGLFGGGSGLVTVPSIYWILVHFYPTSEHYMQVTLGTGCVLAIPMGIIAGWRQIHYGNVDFNALKRCLIPILLGTLCGAFAIDYLHSDTLRYVFSVMLFFVGIWMWRFKLTVGLAWDIPAPLYYLVAILVGFASSLLGVSVFTVPFLMRVGLDIRKAIGTATIVVFAYCVFIGAWFVFLGYNENNLPPQTLGFVSLPILLAGIVPGIAASFLAVKCVNILPHRVIKVLFVGLMFVVSILMVLPH